MDKLDNANIRNLVFYKFSGRCAYCGCKIEKYNFNIDHIKPLRRGDKTHPDKGDNLFTNYNPSCVSCNSSKSSMSIETWRNELGLKVVRINRDSSQYRILKRFGLVKEIKKKQNQILL